MLGVKFGQKEYVLTICRVCLKEDGVLHGYELLAKMLTAKLIDTIIRKGVLGVHAAQKYRELSGSRVAILITHDSREGISLFR
jgi:hypothetical protein